MAEVARLAAECREYSENTSKTPSYELRMRHIDAAWETDEAFRELLGDRLLALYHATRLLPHEVDAIRREGLVVLDETHRSLRLDRVIELYREEFHSDKLEQLRDAGPLSWNASHRNARLGRLWGVTPLQAAFDGAGSGLTVFLEHWGGESFYWANESSPELRETIDLLTARSQPAIVEVGIHATALNTYTKLWPIFVAQLDAWDEPWHEFSTEESIPPERVVEVLDPMSGRWPVRAPKV